MGAGWIVLIVLGSLLLLLVLLLLSRIRLRVRYDENGSFFRLSWFFISKKMTIDDASRLFDGHKKETPENDEEEIKPEEGKEEETEKKLPLSWQIDRVATLISRITDRLPGTLTLRARRVIVTVSTSDAAKTALLYGAVSASLAGVIEVIDRNVARVRTKGRDQIDVRADFVSGKTRAELDLVFSARVAGALSLLFTFLSSGGRKKHKVAAKKKTDTAVLPKSND